MGVTPNSTLAGKDRYAPAAMHRAGGDFNPDLVDIILNVGSRCNPCFAVTHTLYKTTLVSGGGESP